MDTYKLSIIRICIILCCIVQFSTSECAAGPYVPRSKIDLEKLMRIGDVSIDWYDHSITIAASWELGKDDYKFLENGKVLAQRKARWLFDDILVELIKELFRNPVIIMDRYYETSREFNVACRKFISQDFHIVDHDLTWRTDGYIQYRFKAKVDMFGKKGILYPFYPMIVKYIKKYKRLPGQVTSIRDDLHYFYSKKDVYPYHRTVKIPTAVTALIVKLNGHTFKKTLIPVISGTDDRVIFGYNDLDLKRCRYQPCPLYLKTEKEVYDHDWIGEYPYIVNAVKTDKNTIYIPKDDAKKLNLYFKSYPEVIQKNYICIVEE